MKNRLFQLGIFGICILLSFCHPNIMNELDKERLLYNAIRAHDYSTFMIILSSGMDIHANLDKGWDAMNYAAFEGQGYMVDYLLSKGADKNRTSMIESIRAAAKGGHAAILEKLIKRARKHEIDAGFYHKILWDAATFGRTNVISVLLEQNKVNIDVQDRYGNTALSRAVYRGHSDLVKYLVKKGAQTNLFNKKGGSMLILAVKSESLKTVKFVYSLRVSNLEEKDEFGYTALARADGADIIGFLIEKGAKVNEATNGSILESSVYRGDLESVELLLKHGANPNAINSDGDNAILTVCSRLSKAFIDDNPGDSLAIAKVLHKAGTKLDRPNNSGFTPLTNCVVTKQYDMVIWLLKHKVNINQQSINGTPLILATKVGNLKMAELLLKNGADISIMDKDGGTALDIAKTKGSTPLLNLFKKYQSQR